MSEVYKKGVRDGCTYDRGFEKGIRIGRLSQDLVDIQEGILGRLRALGKVVNLSLVR